MTRTQNPTIQIPSERLDQIKAIGAALGGLSIADTIGHLVRAEIERGTIPDTIPGVEIQRTDNGVTLTLGDNPPAHLAKGSARALVEALYGHIDAKGVARAVLDQQGGYMVERRGNGLKLKVPLECEEAKTFSRDLARDLARLVNQAAT